MRTASDDMLKAGMPIYYKADVGIERANQNAVASTTARAPRFYCR
jgi:hypothetical protein